MALRPWLRVTRLPLAATALGDALACGALARCAAGEGLGGVDAAGAILLAATSLLLYAGGMALNDWADRRRDPDDRPLPAGDVPAGGVLALVLLCLAGAVALGGGPLGWRGAVVGAVAGALAYDVGGLRGPVAGPICMGLARFANASLAVWPLVLGGRVSWLLLLAPVLLGTYSAAITLHSTTEEAPRPGRTATARGLVVLAFAGAAVLVWVVGGVPTAGVLVAFGVSTSTLFGRTPRPGPAKRQTLEMLLGIYWLDAVVAGGAHDGTLQMAVPVSVAALGAAWALAILSQLAIRALRRPAT